MQQYKIYPKLLTKFCKKLTAKEILFCKLYPSSVLLFSGDIGQQEFHVALDEALKSCDFLFCRLKTSADGIYAEYSSDSDEYFVSLELATAALKIKDTWDNSVSLLPQLIDERIIKSDNTIDKLPMLYIRLTKLDDGFAVSYYFNHTFLDQSSIMYFLKTLCRHYNHNIKGLQLPKLADVSLLLKEDEKVLFNDISEFRRIGELINKKYCPNFSALRLSMTYFTKLTPCKLIFSKDKLNLFKKTSDCYVSSNDIISAILMKINANDEELQTNQTCGLEIASNMRKYFELTEAAMGNLIVGIVLHDMERSQIKTESIINLAIKIRKIVASHCKSNCSQTLNWYYNIEKNGEDFTHYLLRIMTDPSITATSNWAGFDFSEINFNGNAPLAVEQPLSSQLPYLATITFNNINDQKIIANITLPDNAITYAKLLGAESGLFRVEMQNMQNIL